MSKRPQKRTEITSIKEDTEKMLRDMGANLDNPNYNERRWICNQVIRHSRLAPAFRELGIKDGAFIMNAFFTFPDDTFYKFTLWQHYVMKVYPELLVEPNFTFRSPYRLGAYMRVKDAYYELRKVLHQRIIQSMNAQGAQNTALFAKMNEYLASPLRGKDFTEKYSFAPFKGLYIVARIIKGDIDLTEIREYVNENLDDVIEDFAQNGYSRATLSILHNFSLPVRENGETVVKGSLDGDDFLIRKIFGYGHDFFNDAATAYQDDLLRKLDMMEHWECLDYEVPRADTEQNTEEEMTDIDDEYEEEKPTITTSGSLQGDSVPKQVMDLATKLARIHGPVSITSESSGLHIHLADPELLVKDGEKELKSRHLTVNADKFFGIGRWDVDEYPTRENRELYAKYRSKGEEVICASSMKTGKVYAVTDLLAYVPLRRRHGTFKGVTADVVVSQTRKNLVYDENGNQVPAWVGHTIPLTQLPHNHPAVEYLTQRGYDLLSLEEQFEACYCDQALPESRGEGRFYSRLPGGMKNSPQGRIIFSVRMEGARHGYQSRYIDKWVGPLHYFWSDQQKWVLVHRRLPDGELKHEYPPDTRHRKGFDPHKYMNAVGCERNKLLMGYDAAVKFNEGRPPNKRYCLLVEGPLDAARIGPPALALLGKSLSPFQAEAIRKQFTHVLTVMDNDDAGRQGLRRIHRLLEHNPITDIKLPEGVKDVGELSYEEAAKLIQPHIPQ